MSHNKVAVNFAVELWGQLQVNKAEKTGVALGDIVMSSGPAVPCACVYMR